MNRLIKKDFPGIDGDFLKSFYNKKKPDCILYSNDGYQLDIHKEILCQTKFMCKILSSTEGFCCQNLEIFCPCPAIELESMMKFLYEGQISCDTEKKCQQVLKNLTTIFGFPKDVEMADNTNEKAANEIGIYKSENVSPSYVENYMNSNTTLDNSDFNDKTVQEMSDKWTCSICFDVLKSRKTFRDHISSAHKGKKPFNCLKCDSQFSRADSLKKHDSLFHYNESPNMSDIDDSEMDLDETDISNLCETNLDIGMNEFEPITLAANEVKKEISFDQNDSLNAHEDSVTEFSNTNNSPNTEFEKEVLWICSICNIDLKDRKNLREHVASLHMSPKSMELNNFKHEVNKEISFNKDNPLNNHEKSVIRCSDTRNLTNASFEKELLWMCPICDIDLKYRENLRKHVASFHKGQKPFQCFSCDARFELKDSLKRHQNLKHVDQMGNEITEKNSNEISDPVEARIGVGAAQELPMTNCMSNGFFDVNVTPTNVMWNPKTEKERKWTCPTCNTDFQSRRILRNHIAFVHRGQKPFT